MFKRLFLFIICIVLTQQSTFAYTDFYYLGNKIPAVQVDFTDTAIADAFSTKVAQTGLDAYYSQKLDAFYVTHPNVNNLGMNLSHNHYWSTQWMFTDFMKQSWTWYVQDTDMQKWDINSVDIPLGEYGYPLEIPYISNGKSYQVHTLMFFDNNYNDLTYPTGVYHLRFEGQGEILLDFGDHVLTFDEANKQHPVSIQETSDFGVNLIIKRSSKDNPIRNISFVMPGYSETYMDNPYHPKLLKFIEPMGTLRFMKALYTEENGNISWQNRTKPNHYTQNDMELGGLAYEYIIDLCNRTGKDPWITLPHAADDTYIKELSILFESELRNDLTLYVEYSNEPFNFLYPIYDYAIAMGQKEGIKAESNHLIGSLYAVKRSVEIFEIMEENMDEVTFKSVLSLEYVNPEQGKAIVDGLKTRQINPNAYKVDCLAIAPYFGGEVANDIGDRITKDLSPERQFEKIEDEFIKLHEELIPYYQELATANDFELVTYEAGSHFVSLFYPEDELLVKIMKEVNSHENMYHAYMRFMKLWDKEVGGLVTYFVSIEAPNKYGDFGVIHHLNQEWSDSPKYRALRDYYFAE